MSPRTQKQFEKMREDRREAIMKAALQVFAENGYQGASIAKVSKQAGVSKGLLYNYFESKEALLHQLLDSLFEAEVEIIAKIDPDKFDGEAFKAYLDHIFELLLSNPAQWKLYFSLSSQPHILAVLLEKYKDEYANFAQCVNQFFIAKGHPNPTAFISYFYATLGGIKIQLVMNGENFPVNDVKELLFKQFID